MPDFKGSLMILFGAVWAIIRRDLILKYHQTYLGPVWTIIKPWSQVWALYLLLGALNRLGPDLNNDALQIYFAVVIWQFFVSVLSDGGLSLVNNPTLLQRSKFPIFALPLAYCGFYFLELLIHLLIGAGILLYKNQLSINIIWSLPTALFFSLLLTSGLAMILAPLNYIFKDIRFIMPFVFQVGFILTPLAASFTDFNTLNMGWIQYNPIIGLIKMTALMIKNNSFDFIKISTLVVISVASVFIGISGLRYFEQKGRQ
jgi:lipopolysaccharide transport system permease protein